MLREMHALLAAIALASPAPVKEGSPWEREVFYQIFPRSFRDSNGDRIGDLRGITSKLGYLEGLGVTAIVLNPIAESRVYHNYFADDFMRVDREFGTEADLHELARQAHRRKMKVLLDMEPQYVTERHPWLRAYLDDAGAVERNYLWTTGSWLWGRKLPWYDGADVRVAAINPNNPAVRASIRDAFVKWAKLGVDGFRIDHMMDDLDSKGVKTGLLAGFWRPMFAEIRRQFPRTFFVAEQGDWGLGGEHLTKADVDAVYAMPLWGAIRSFDRDKIARSIQETEAVTPPGKTQVIWAESHDVDRLATAVGDNPAKMRLAAVLTFALKGVPMLYYGQELGMRGRKGPGPTDGSDIPNRLAFEWNRLRDAPGTALWYRDTGPWWNDEFTRDDDGVSLEEEVGEESSLLEFYRRLIALRRRDSALSGGSQRVVDVGAPDVLAIERRFGGRVVMVLANLSPVAATVAWSGKVDLWTNRPLKSGRVTVPAYGFRILGRRGKG